MRRAIGALLALAVSTAMAQPTAPRVLDDFTEASAWHVGATDDVKASLRPVAGGLCVDYDFGRVSGYVTLRRPLPIDFPERYGFELDVRGDAANTFQFKLVDAGGENVWWVPKPAFAWPADWQRLRLRQRQIAFAWGPTPDRTLRHGAAVELVIVSGAGAAKGSACFGRLAFQALPDEAPPLPPPAMAADGRGVDFGVAREFDALDLRWPPGTAPSSYAIEFSDDGERWRRVRTVDRARGDVQPHWLPDSETRFVRVVGDAGLPRLAAIEPGAAPTADAFFARLAQRAPRGVYPRSYVGEQSYWTVFGVDGGPLPSLLSEDGVVEPVPGVGALEPMLIDGGRALTWADADARQSLRDGDLPLPSVHWRFPADALALDIEAYAAGTPAAAQAWVRYRVTNRAEARRAVVLALAWRPFQANPPTQFLAHPGGASAVGRLAWDGGALSVDGVVRVRPRVAPSSVRVEPLAAGPVATWPAGAGPRAVVDAAGHASASLRYELDLGPGESREIDVALPVVGEPAEPASVAREAERVAAHWRERLGRVRIDGPPEVAALAETVRAALGHILVNRSGPALQPGPRAYARSWIRDGALTSSALLRLGQDDVVRDFLRWYAPFQFTNGKVPCCATARGGADPVPENDSDGEFIFAVADHWRHTRDDATARALWPHVRAAAEHMESLRAGERSDANRDPARRGYFGLMPPSISHEGYSDKPAYSYWDDFWTAIGDRSAVQLAAGLGFADDAARFAARRAAFLADLRASVEESARRYGRSLVFGAADRGDLDPTSTTVALAPGGLLGALPEPLLRNTFDRYWQDFAARRDGTAKWSDYTPYEWRNVGALVRLGERERALEAIDFFRADRRPAGWNQWAEVVMRDPRAPHFLGDMPHGWVESDQIRSVLDLFAYEREADEALVLAAGVPMRWLAGRGVAIQELRTPFGRLAWSARTRREQGRDVVVFELGALRDAPPGGIEVRGPWPASAAVWVDGRRQSGGADVIHVTRTPARVRVALPRGP